MLWDKPTSVTLLHRLRNRDQDAWHRLYELYAPLVTHWCNRWGVRGADADDVVQEVFQGVAAGLPGFRRDRPGDTFRGWLRIITRHKVLDHFRRSDRHSPAQGGSAGLRQILEIPEPEPAEDDESEQREVSGLYHRALQLVRGEFEERTWVAFWRAAVDGQAPAVIAADLGVSPAAVRQAKSRVLRRLKEEVGDLIA